MKRGIGTSRLTDKAIKAFVTNGEPGKKLSDGGGLYLYITKVGTPTWRVRYSFGAREKLYSIGVYPLVGLAGARNELAEVKQLLRQGQDPVTNRRLVRAAKHGAARNTFEMVALDWLNLKQEEWGTGHFTKSARALERDVFPSLGKLPIGAITPAMVATTILGINKRGVLETTSRILQHVNGVFRYAQAKGLCRDNPAAPAREILPRKKDSGRMPALLNFPALGDILRRARKARLSPAVHLAHRLCAFTAMRIGNIVSAEWGEFNLDEDRPIWVIPRQKMKVTSRLLDHRIPLSQEIAEELRQWGKLIGKTGPVFPSYTAGRTHIGPEAIEKMYRMTLGLAGKHSPHGWRSAFSTLARDKGFERDVVELALDHAHDNEIVRAYDRGERFAQRIELFNWWGAELAAAERRN